MVGFPKPTKLERQEASQARRHKLSEYRRAQAAIAIDRDNNQCVFCWFLQGKITRRDDVHHVYGRGRDAGDWRENYQSLVCTCRRHHPQPIQTKGGPHDLDWVEVILRQANETPINPKFYHVNKTTGELNE